MGRLVLVTLALVVLAGGALLWRGRFLRRGEEHSNLVVELVKRGPLEITITERGNLESANSQRLICMVEGEAGTGILEIVEEGKVVKKGQEVIKLDRSKLTNDLTAQQITRENASAARETAEKGLEIQEKQNESDIAAAKLKLELDLLDLTKYEEGDYKQEKDTIEGEIELAKEERSRSEDKYEFTQRLIKKGYAKQSELEADRVAVAKAKINLEVAQGKLDVLNGFTYKRQIAELKANASESEKELRRVELKATAQLAKYKADLKAAELTYKVEQEKFEKIERQLEACTIVAPCDGLVVYVNQRSGGFRGAQEPLIYEGAKVKERQPIIDLPDVENMRVNARIHESKISMVRVGLPATIHLDAKAGMTYHGEVSEVSLVPTSGNWPNINLKEYITFIKLTDEVEKVSELKPGLTAEIEILIDRLSNVLQVPLQSFVERGGRHFAWVLEGAELVRKEVKVGKSNEQVMEIVEGLVEGEKVVQTPRTVLVKEVAQLEQDVPVTVESPTMKLKTPEAGLPPGPGGGDGGRGGRGGRSPGESAGTAGEQAGRGGRGGGRGDPAAFFASLDKDADGKISESEIPEQMKPMLSKADKNGDKFIDKDEFMKAVEAARAAMGGGGRAGAGGGQ
jgi:HlyD family secretion protein